MAHSYTPGLTVTERISIRRRRLLPIPGTVLAEVGTRTTAEQVVAKTDLPGKVHAVNLANLLGVAPDEVHEYLIKRIGERVGRDEVIAESRPLIKWFKTEVRSPIDGVLESVSSVTGQALLRAPARTLDLLAYVDGTIVETHPGQGVTVQTDCAFIQGIFGIGGETWGPLAVGVDAPDATLSAARLTPDFKGKVVIGGSFIGTEVLKRAKEIGVSGLVVGGMHDKDLRELLGYDLGVAITGTERVGFTLILTEGFGMIPMAKKTFDLLGRYVGRKASISGATQIRAGVIRPEIIIAGDGAAASAAPPPTEKAGIQLGDPVRVIRDPLFGKIGKVVALPHDLRTIETESLARVLEVEFPDGKRAVIPRANVEILEG